MSRLTLQNVSIRFGGLIALEDVSFAVEPGQIVGIIGPNGAGKSTLFNVLSGVYSPTVGEIRLDGQLLNGLKPSDIAQRGITRTFQNIRLFNALPGFDNVLIGCHRVGRTGLLGALLGGPGVRSEERALRQRTTECLELVGLTGRGDELARNLAYGDRRRLEIARALAAGPQILLLDEPAAGMNAAEKEALVDLVRQVRSRGISVLLVEHDMNVIMGLSDHVVVLNYGRKLSEGKPAEVQADPAVIAAYLGGADA